MSHRRRLKNEEETERMINKKNSKTKKKKKEIEPLYWPVRRKSFRRFTVKKKHLPIHSGGNIDFKVVKINSYGKRQKRKLRCSREGISNLARKGTKWFIKAEDIYSISKSQKSKSAFVLTALHRFNFEVEEEGQVERIIDAFRSLNLGKFPKKKTQKRGKSVPRSLETKFSFVQRYKINEKSFDILSMIGRGSYGKVYQVKHKKSNKIFGMKVLNKGEIYRRKQVEHTRTEQLVLSTISHPFIVTLHYSFQNEKNLFLVLDYVKGGELFFHLKRAGRGRFPEYLAMFYIAEIILAIEYLHKRNIVYRDLKPENVLLNEDGHIKLTDFGLAKTRISFSKTKINNTKKKKKKKRKNKKKKKKKNEKEIEKIGSEDEYEDEDEENQDNDDQKTQTFCGTPAYFAPEVLKRNAYGNSVDCWTIGVFLYEMLTGMPPFIAENRNEMFRAIINNEPTFPNYVSEEASDLISGLLQKKPENRLGINGFNKVKRHDFFKKIDWVKLEKKKIAPPFKPIVKEDPNDVSCFDSKFTKKQIQDVDDDEDEDNKDDDEEEESQKKYSLLAKNEFPGFYYEKFVKPKTVLENNDLETLYLGEVSSDDDFFDPDEEILSFDPDEKK
ncbi:camp-dependent protein kinase catalytic subunit prkx [Anaeramoeba flamelloides]|uniref:Camp-dependent protein kinase catalytic subunit prkx n=1 Tax=Anaeramoeba flamelloides TaxID=1746091 RepID=A0ABQ8Z2C9_9EUKA|nr:camp-dependent protein kinase catalytic subunit prkx [Anaeramoeba flamelloides]